jgi:glycosyltransferase involved in cell wall biosynthesis
VRIGIVVYGPLDRRSGGYLYDRELADRFAAGGDEVVAVELPERPYPLRPLDNVDPRVGRRIRGADVDVLLEDELCHPSLLGVNRRVDVPAVSIVHHLASAEPRPPWRGRAVAAAERAFCRSVDAHVCVSHTTRASVAALVGGTDADGTPRSAPRTRAPLDPTPGAASGERPVEGGPDRDRDRDRVGDGGHARTGGSDRSAGRIGGVPTVVAHPGGDRLGDPIDRERIRERADDGPLRVLFVGSVTPRKRVDTLIDGLARVTEPWELTVVGDASVAPGYVDRVRERVASLDVDDRVTFAGRVDDDDLASAFRRHHLLTVPSSYEGFGIVYVEAMRFGLPVVASAQGGGREVVEPRTNGRLVEPGDASAITDVVSPLCRDRDRLAAMGLAARETALAHPTWDETAERVRGFLADVVDDRG